MGWEQELVKKKKAQSKKARQAIARRIFHGPVRKPYSGMTFGEVGKKIKKDVRTHTQDIEDLMKHL